MASPAALQGIESTIQEWIGVLDSLQTFDVAWGRSERFRIYVETFKEVAALEERRMTGVADPFRGFRAIPTKQQLLFEGTSQVLHIQKASQSFSHLDPAVLSQKLEKVMRGAPLPCCTSSDADDARDALVELQAVALLEDCGFDAQITVNDEDIRLESPEGKIILVECKRPVSKKSIKNAVKKLRNQLRRRNAQTKLDCCMAVFAIERTCLTDATRRRMGSESEILDIANAEVNKSAEHLDRIFQHLGLSDLAPAFLVTYSSAFWFREQPACLYPFTTSLPYYPKPDVVPAWLKRAFDSVY